MAAFTCLSCHVAFADGDGQRDHFRSDWHRYNLMRKMSDLPPVTRETYNEKVVQVQGQCAKAKVEAEAQKPYCQPCKKTFGSQMAYENHIKSNKHIKMTLTHAEEAKNRKNLQMSAAAASNQDEETDDEDDDDIEVEELDSDEWEELEGEPVPVNDCLFCEQEFDLMEDKLKHMTVQHNFFVPELEYCTDVPGLMTYLGWKLGCGFECLVCSYKARRFPSLVSTRQHMLDKDHCRIELTGDRLLEYEDFYDFSVSYPDADHVGPDTEVEPNVLTATDSELVLPSGAVVGHRSLRRYYKQNLRPYHKEGEIKKKRGAAFQNILLHYRALGWTGLSGVEAANKFRDIRFAQKARNKYQMKLGVKGNKLQQHFRNQNPI